MGEPEQWHNFFKLKSILVKGQTGTATGQKHPAENKSNATAKRQAQLKSHPKRSCFELPKGLIGTKSTAHVWIEGNDVS